MTTGNYTLKVTVIDYAGITQFLKDVLIAIEKLVAEHPVAIYHKPPAQKGQPARCLYTQGSVSEPGVDGVNSEIFCGCIIGVALLRVDPDLADVLAANDDGMHNAASEVINACVQKKFGVNLTADNTDRSKIGLSVWKFAELVDAIQSEQDTGETWIQALTVGRRDLGYQSHGRSLIEMVGG